MRKNFIFIMSILLSVKFWFIFSGNSQSITAGQNPEIIQAALGAGVNLREFLSDKPIN